MMLKKWTAPFVLASFVMLSTGAQAGPAKKVYQEDPRWQHVSTDNMCEVDGFDAMFPFSLNKDMHPEVDDIVMTTFLFNSLLPMGGLWGPLVTLPDDHPDMAAGDVVSSYLVPYAVGWGTLVVFGSLCPAMSWITTKGMPCLASSVKQVALKVCGDPFRSAKNMYFLINL